MHAVLICPRSVVSTEKVETREGVRDILLGDTTINVFHLVENYDESAEAGHVLLLLDCGPKCFDAVKKCYDYLTEKFGTRYVVQVQTFSRNGPSYTFLPTGVIAA